MGNSTSKRLLETPLQAQAAPIAAVDTRFCFPELVTLHLHAKCASWSGGDFEIRDVRTKQPVFHIKSNATSFTDRKRLCDVNGEALAYVRNEFTSIKPPVYHISSDIYSNKPILHVRTLERSFHVVLATDFTDAGTGVFWRVLVEGDWRARAAVISLVPTSGSNIKRIPVARIYRPPQGDSTILGRHDYYADIAPNVDMALVVLLCFAMDDCKKNRNGNC